MASKQNKKKPYNYPQGTILGKNHKDAPFYQIVKGTPHFTLSSKEHPTCFYLPKITLNLPIQSVAPSPASPKVRNRSQLEDALPEIVICSQVPTLNFPFLFKFVLSIPCQYSPTLYETKLNKLHGRHLSIVTSSP